MTARLLLASGAAEGEALRILDIRVAHDPPVLAREALKVERASVNGAHRGDLALSARHAGDVALGLLFRELNRNDPVAQLWIDIEAPSRTVSGRSGELLFALATYLKLAGADLPEGVPATDFMATGTLDPDGNVGSVDAVPAKLRAALASSPAPGTRLFYPRADVLQIDDALMAAARDAGLLLCPVDRIDEALDALGVPIVGAWPSGVSPFMALDPFDRAHSRVFFGRQREIGELAEQLARRATAGRPGALVIGASGAGKSSFCIAGLLPAFAREHPDLEYVVWRPRDALGGASGEPVGELQILESLRAKWRERGADQTGLPVSGDAGKAITLDALAACVHLPAPGQCRVLVVDQFEELFALDFAEAARIAFARFLKRLQEGGLWVVATMRSEFYPDYLELHDGDGVPLLPALFGGDGQYNLPRMSREALRQVIVRPAELAGLRFEERSADGVRLDDVLLADALAADDALPLLGFALQTLYEAADRPASGGDRTRSRPRTLGFAAYEGLGGLVGAIGTVAAAAYGRLDEEARGGLPELLAALAVPSADGARETARPAPVEQWSAGSPARRLIDALTGIRVLISEQGAAPGAPPQIRVAHEALFSHWDEAGRLLAASRQNRLLIEDFRQRADQWDAAGRHRDALLSSPRDLENARAIGPAVPAVESHAPLVTFVQTSITRARRERRTRLGAAAMMALMLIGLTGWALNGQRVAAQQTEVAQRQTVRAETALAEAQRQRRVAVAASGRAQVSARSERAQRTRAEQRERDARTARAGEARQRTLAEQRLAEANTARASEAAQTDRAIRGEQAARTTLRSFFAVRAEQSLTNDQPTAAARYSLAGLALSPENSVELRRSLARSLYASGIDGPPLEGPVVALSPSGRYIASFENSTLIAKDIDGATIAQAGLLNSDFTTEQRENMRNVSISAIYFANETLLVADFNFQIPLAEDGQFHTENGSLMLSLPGGERRVLMAPRERRTEQGYLTPDLRYRFADHRIYPQDGGEPRQLEGRGCPVNAFAYAPRTSQLAIACVDKSIRVFDIASGRLLGSRPATEEPGFVLRGFSPVVFSADGMTIAYALGDNRLTLWNWRTQATREVIVEEGANLSAIALDESGALAALGDERGGISLIDLASGRILRKFIGHSTYVRNLRFTDGNAGLVSRDDYGIARRWRVPSAGTSLVPNGSGGGSPIALSTSGRRFATRAGARILVGDVENGRTVAEALLDTAPGEEPSIRAVAFSADDRILAVARMKGQAEADANGNTYGTVIDIFDLTTGARLRKILGGSMDYFQSVALSADGALVAVSLDGEDGEIRIFDTRTGAQIDRIEFPHASFIAFGGSEQTLLVGSKQGVLYTWDRRTNALAGAMDLGGEVRAVALSKSGDYAAVLSDNWSARSTQAVTILDLSHRQNLVRIPLGRNIGTSFVRDLVFSSSADALLLMSQGGRLTRYDIRYLTADAAMLGPVACRALLDPSERRFTRDELLVDSLLRTEWAEVDRDVCGLIADAPTAPAGAIRRTPREVPAHAAGETSQGTVVIRMGGNYEPQ